VEGVLPHLGDDDPAKPKVLATASLLAVMQGDWAAAIAHGERCGELSVGAGDELLRLEVANAVGRALLAVGEEERALALFSEAAARGVDVGRPSAAAIALLNLGYVALLRGEPGTAREQFEHSCELAREAEDGHVIARALGGLASAALEDGRLEDGRQHAAESLAISVPAHDGDNAGWALELAGCASAAADAERAALLLGAAEEVRTALGGSLSGLEQAQHERALSLLSDSLDPDGLAAALQDGRSLPLEDAAALAG
jgi:tetratricopeptide (TPR) repeat protein